MLNPRDALLYRGSFGVRKNACLSYHNSIRSDLVLARHEQIGEDTFMKQKKLVFASLFCIVGLTLASCANETGKSQYEEEPNEQKDCVSTYHLTLSGTEQNAFTCDADGNCDMTLNANASYNVIAIALTVSSENPTDSNGNACPSGGVAGAEITLSSEKPIILNDDGNNTKVETSELGLATVTVAAGDAENVATLKITTDAAHGSLSNRVFVTIPPSSVIEPEKMDLQVKIAYAGEQALSSSDVLLFEDKTCAEILNSPNDPLTRDEIFALQKDATDSKADYQDVNGAVMTFRYDKNEHIYAAVGRGLLASAYTAYGCTDGLSASKNSVTVTLKDAMTPGEENEKICESKRCDLVTANTDENYAFCLANNCIDPIVTVNGVYTGTYFLQSQFSALSLLPHSNSNDFSQMLAGDWIQWSLDLLAHPESKVPDIVADQLIPLILNADWLKGLLEKFGVSESILAFLSPEMISSLLESFGIKKIIEDSLSQLLGQLGWWDTASSVITIVDEIATNLTLSGSFMINEEPNNDDELLNNIHSYSHLLYNTGKFDCYFGASVGTDVNGNNICSVSLSTLDSTMGSVYGAFKGELSGCDSNGICSEVVIFDHSLKLAYGKLIYGVIMQFLPQLLEQVGLGSSADIHSIGSLIEYYAGFGLVKAWNAHATKWNDEHAAEIAEGTSKALEILDESTVTSCNAVATSATNFVGSWLAGTGFGELVSKFLQPALITPLCKNGIAKLDDLIDSKLSNVTAGTDAIKFSTPNGKPCVLNFGAQDAATGNRVLESFGMTEYIWGQKTDNRCEWQMSIKGSEDGKTLKVEGKFFAPRSND